MFLLWLYYRIVPAAGDGRLAKIQAAIHIIGAIVIGAIVLPIGIALVLLGGTEVLVILGSLIVLVAMALFGWIVFGTAPA
jgi:hypothetical protein